MGFPAKHGSVLSPHCGLRVCCVSSPGLRPELHSFAASRLQQIPPYEMDVSKERAIQEQVPRLANASEPGHESVSVAALRLRTLPESLLRAYARSFILLPLRGCNRSQVSVVRSAPRTWATRSEVSRSDCYLRPRKRIRAVKARPFHPEKVKNCGELMSLFTKSQLWRSVMLSKPPRIAQWYP